MKTIPTVRLLHTADWHLGIRLGRHDRRPDTTTALEALLAVVEQEQPDAVLHAGDIFDHERPPQSAVEDAVNALTEITKHCPVVVAAGNHDGKRLLKSIDKLAQEAEPQRLIIATEPTVVTVNQRGDRRRQVTVAAVPWLSAGEGLEAWTRKGQQETDSNRPPHAKWLAGVSREIVAEARQEADWRGDTARPNPVALVSHTHLAGAVVGEALREVAVSSLYAVEPGELPTADYCALGHIHDRQEIATGTDRSPGVYSGSLVRTTFGERDDPKSVEVVDLEHVPDNGWTVTRRERHALDSGRQLHEFHGRWAELAGLLEDGGLRSCILKARVRTEDRMYDLTEQIARRDPTVILHDVRNDVDNPQAGDAANLSFQEVAEPPIEELYRQWRQERLTAERENDDDAVDLLKAAIAATQGHRPEAFRTTGLQERFHAIMAELAGDRDVRAQTR